VLAAFRAKDGASALRWFRSTGWRHSVGDPVANSGDNTRAILALGALSGGDKVSVSSGGILRLPDASAPASSVPVILLQAARAPLGSHAAAEAHNRVADARTEGRIGMDVDAVVVCTGHVGPLGEDEVQVGRGARLQDVLAARKANIALDGVPEHLIDEADSEHLLDSINAGHIILLAGDTLIEAA